MKSWLWLVLPLLVVGCAASPYSNVDNARLKALLAQGVPLYDAHRPEEWRQTGVMEGSRKLTFVDFGGRLNPEFIPTFTWEVARDQPVIVICRTGNRTDALARELMDKMGYTKMCNVCDGIIRWIGEGNPEAMR